ALGTPGRSGWQRGGTRPRDAQKLDRTGGPAYEPELVVVLDRRQADNNVTEPQAAAEAASRSRADHNLKVRPLLDQVLSPHRELGLSISAHREQQAELLEEMALDPPQSQFPQLVARRNERPE